MENIEDKDYKMEVNSEYILNSYPHDHYNTIQVV